MPEHEHQPEETMALGRRSSGSTSAVYRWLRRQDRRDVWARDERPRHPGAPGRAVRRRGRPRPDQPDNDAVLEDVREWQSRPLEDVYPILFLDALIVKVRDGGAVRNLACYVAIGVNLDGERDVLGLWFQRSEGAKFWLAVLNELKQRGVHDVLICCVDGLKGFPEAIEAVFAHAWVQTCIVHLIRHSLRFVPDKHRKTVAKDLRPIYTAVDADGAAEALTSFGAIWGERYPMITTTWRESWEHVIPFLAFPTDVRRVVYTTNSIEALHRQIRKTIKTRGHFPTEEAARKLIYLSIINPQKSWKQTYHWSAALLSFKIHFGDRLP